ncbi:hypothetical protein Q3V30_12970 [Erwinia pyri]|uniref:Uncharacterized protein n=1 Tax=Erwinia pyri TaxID=3062598 RepID=A0AA50DG02_9GAMM|nr:hypothetical protein [Erwinia sp. DE2]WLS77397.1 hypothetical protein Q3V30_12970 [Erwinia sp. DE2]
MKEDYIVIGAGHDGEIYQLEPGKKELPIIPSPVVRQHRHGPRSEIETKKMEILAVSLVEHEGHFYNVVSESDISSEQLGEVIKRKFLSPRPVK